MFRFAQADDLPHILDKAVHGKMGFEVWGRLPQVADMETHFEDLIILGLKKK